MHNNDTLFLDRDGVINKKLEERYVRNFSEFKFIKGSLQAISQLSTIFNRIIIVTNQQGIGKGLMSDSDLNKLHLKMNQRIELSAGKIDKIYYCPHLANLECNCRKPKTGMILQAKVDYPSINFEKSYLIGDSDSDIEAGKRMDLKTIKVDDNYTLAKWAVDLLAVS
jgi:D-glycero-D-manno-heptose 1,7-bisphosphate phosphatase